MKIKFLTVAMMAALVLASCGSKKTDSKKTNDTTNTTSETQQVDENKPLVKDYDYFATKLNGFTLDGITLTKDNVNDNPDTKDIRRSWTMDPSTAGCDKISMTVFSLARSGNRKEMESKTLEDFKTFQTKYADPKSIPTDFKEYKKDSLTFFYCTYKGVSGSLGSPKNYNQILFSHFTGDIGINGYVQIYDTKMDLKKAEETTIKSMDFLAKP
jgi:hypothetical protein